VDNDTREILLELTRKVERLSTLVERNITDDDDKETRLRKVEKWLYAVPLAYVFTLASLITTLARTSGK